MLRAKIHRATVTRADLSYEGSIMIPRPLVERCDFLPNEEVHIWNVTSGTRFQTYVIVGEPGSNEISVNGAAAHLVKPGDLIIIAAFVSVPEEMAREHQPIVVFVDERNQFKEVRPERLPTL
jgi:aspartate 1-decarboxylase